MKLIVDIDKELKGAVYRCGLFLNPTEKTSLINAINNGIPLDKIRAEIKTMGGDIETISDALEIIDKYRGGE